MTGGRVRVGTAPAVGAALAAFAVMVLAAPTAVAATSDITVTRSDGTAVPDGGVVTADDVLQIAGHLAPNTGTTSLEVHEPDGIGHTVASGSTLLQSKTLSYNLQTSCVSFDGSGCSGRHPALNGPWTVDLRGGENESRTFVLRIPPARVQGVTSVSQGSAVTIGWQPGAEPDLVSYDVLDSTGHPVATGLRPADVCQPGQPCAVTIDLGPGSSGQYAFVVRAWRSTCPGCSEALASPDSEPTTVTVTAPAAPAPSGAPSGRADAGSSAPATTSGDGASRPQVRTVTPAQRRALALRYRNVATARVSAGAAPDLPAVAAAAPEGSYQPVLSYPDQTVREVVRRPLPVQLRIGRVLAAVADTRTVWQSLAAALVLMLAAAHTRAWLVRTRGD